MITLYKFSPARMSTACPLTDSPQIIQDASSLNQTEVLRGLRVLKSNKSPCPKGIFPRVLKENKRVNLQAAGKDF